MAQFVLKIEKLSHIMGPRGSQDLLSPSPIMAPDLTYKICGDVVHGGKNYFHVSVRTGEFMNFPCPALTQRAKHSTSYKLFLR